MRETLSDLADEPEGPEPPAREPGGVRSPLRRLRARLEAARRHEDTVLAAALLVGILLMILHWVR